MRWHPARIGLGDNRRGVRSNVGRARPYGFEYFLHVSGIFFLCIHASPSRKRQPRSQLPYGKWRIGRKMQTKAGLGTPFAMAKALSTSWVRCRAADVTGAGLRATGVSSMTIAASRNPSGPSGGLSGRRAPAPHRRAFSGRGRAALARSNANRLFHRLREKDAVTKLARGRRMHDRSDYRRRLLVAAVPL